MYPLIVVSAGYSSTPVPVSIARVQPAIYTADSSGSGQGVIGIAGTAIFAGPSGDGSRPALRGEYLTIYCNGLGPVGGPNGESAPADGVAASTTIAFQTTGQVTVSIGGHVLPAQFAGLAPGEVAVYQVNVQVPAVGLSGDAIPVFVAAINPQTGEVTQSNTVTVALR